jgi:formylglycine-generating enzyme required for sulfatase activity
MRTNLTFLLSLLLLLTGAMGVTGAYAQRSTLAVLVVGMETDTKGDAFAAALGSDLNRNGEYELATKDNNPVVASKLAELRTKHAQGAKVDTTGLAAWGKANGIGFVQLVVESGNGVVNDLFAEVEQVAQLVDCSTGELSGRSTYRERFTPKGVKHELVMVRVAGGVFEMGCNSSRDGVDGMDGMCLSGERPLHYVKVNSFRIGKYPVTQAQWRAVMGSLPSDIKSTVYLGDSKPMIYVSYNDIVGPDGFLEKLNALTGRNFRLPTEAEWEYAARGCSAGSCESYKYSGSNTIGDVAWYKISSGNPNGPQPVGTKAPNELGIYDMSGNVWEWCGDWYASNYYPSGTTQDSPQENPTGPESGSDRVVRGGDWNNPEYGCRVAFRVNSPPDEDFSNHGFRVVLP